MTATKIVSELPNLTEENIAINLSLSSNDLDQTQLATSKNMLNPFRPQISEVLNIGESSILSKPNYSPSQSFQKVPATLTTAIISQGQSIMDAGTGIEVVPENDGYAQAVINYYTKIGYYKPSTKSQEPIVASKSSEEASNLSKSPTSSMHKRLQPVSLQYRWIGDHHLDHSQENLPKIKDTRT